MSKFLLDTNVLSELYDMENGDQNVNRWVRNQSFDNLFTTALNIAEIQYGIENVPPGRQRTILQHSLNNYILPQFYGHILSFELKAAEVWGSIRAEDRKRGTQRPIMDGLLAAIAIANDLGIVTRNVRDFAGLDIDLLNPWH
jgi:predicted nucleic acid-binding protein